MGVLIEAPGHMGVTLRCQAHGRADCGCRAHGRTTEMLSINVIGSQARLVLMRKKQRTLMHMTVEEELIWVQA